MATLSSETKKNKWVTLAIESAILVLAVGLGLAIRFGVYESAIVVSRSMQPTLQVDDRMLVDHRASLAGTWQRGNVVLFNAPQSWGGDEDYGGFPSQLVKRIIGLPGEEIYIAGDGQIYINGSTKPLNEPYIAERELTQPVHVVLRSDEYFMMGDNRGNSEDSRDHGPIRDTDIHGRAIRIFWPPGRSGAIATPTYH